MMQPKGTARSRISALVIIPAMATVLPVGLACDSTTGVNVPFSFEIVSQQDQKAEGNAADPQVTSSVSGSTVVVRGTAFTPCSAISIMGQLDMKSPREAVVDILWTENRSACSGVADDYSPILPYEARVGPLDSGTYTLIIRQPILKTGTTWDEETVHTAELRIP